MHNKHCPEASDTGNRPGSRTAVLQRLSEKQHVHNEADDPEAKVVQGE